MKPFRNKMLAVLWAVTFGVLVPGAASAGGEVTAEVLVDYCGVTGQDPEAHTAIAFCYGYIDAALDYHHAILPDGKRITCPPGTVTRQDVALAVVEWAEINTDKVDDQSPVHVVMQAASDKWPCEEE